MSSIYCSTCTLHIFWCSCFNFSDNIFAILLLPPFGKGHCTTFKQITIPFLLPKETTKFGWHWLYDSGEGSIQLNKKKIVLIYICFFVIFFFCPWKRAWLITWTNKNFPHQGCFVPSLWNWSSGSGKDF